MFAEVWGVPEQQQDAQANKLPQQRDSPLALNPGETSPKEESFQLELNFTILFVKKLQAEFINRHFYLKQENDKVASNNSRAHASNRNILTSSFLFARQRAVSNINFPKKHLKTCEFLTSSQNHH